jgi:hypothetical protein
MYTEWVGVKYWKVYDARTNVLSVMAMTAKQFILCVLFSYTFYICIVHTVVLFQSLVGAYYQTQHVKYW